MYLCVHVFPLQLLASAVYWARIRSFGPLKSWLLLVTQEEMTELWRGIEQSQPGLHVKRGTDLLWPLTSSDGAIPMINGDSALGTAEEYVNLSRR